MKCVPSASILQTTDSAHDIERDVVTSLQRISLCKLGACRFLCELLYGVLVHIGTVVLRDRRTV